MIRKGQRVQLVTTKNSIFKYKIYDLEIALNELYKESQMMKGFLELKFKAKSKNNRN